MYKKHRDSINKIKIMTYTHTQGKVGDKRKTLCEEDEVRII
jgi:hypothetical protein